MKRLALNARHLLLVGVLGAVALFSTASPASAATERQQQVQAPVITATATCDVSAQQWVVTWLVTTPNAFAGTIGNVRVTPAGQPLVGLPSRMPAGGTIAGIQRVGGNEPSASITFDVNWDFDLAVTYNVTQMLRFTSPCGPPTPGRTILVSHSVACDVAARQWVITYIVTNPNPIGATLGNIRVSPAGFPLLGLSTRVLPFMTVTGAQRIPGNVHNASLTFDVNWDDNTVTYDVSDQVFIAGTCGAAA